jgi:hypothetical protein
MVLKADECRRVFLFGKKCVTVYEVVVALIDVVGRVVQFSVG